MFILMNMVLDYGVKLFGLNGVSE